MRGLGTMSSWSRNGVEVKDKAKASFSTLKNTKNLQPGYLSPFAAFPSHEWYLRYPAQFQQPAGPQQASTLPRQQRLRGACELKAPRRRTAALALPPTATSTGRIGLSFRGRPTSVGGRVGCARARVRCNFVKSGAGEAAVFVCGKCRDGFKCSREKIRLAPCPWRQTAGEKKGPGS